MSDITSFQDLIDQAIKEKDLQINGLNIEIIAYKQRENEYSQTIDNHKKEENNQENKFDIIRSQAKEISAKDKELIKTTKEP